MRAKQAEESGGRGDMRASQRAIHKGWKPAAAAASRAQASRAALHTCLSLPQACCPPAQDSPELCGSPRQPPPVELAQGTRRRCSGKAQEPPGSLQWCQWPWHPPYAGRPGTVAVQDPQHPHHLRFSSKALKDLSPVGAIMPRA